MLTSDASVPYITEMADDTTHKQVFNIRKVATRSVTLYPARAQIVRDINNITLKVSCLTLRFYYGTVLRTLVRKGIFHGLARARSKWFKDTSAQQYFGIGLPDVGSGRDATRTNFAALSLLSCR